MTEVADFTPKTFEERLGYLQAYFKEYPEKVEKLKEKNEGNPDTDKLEEDSYIAVANAWDEKTDHQTATDALGYLFDVIGETEIKEINDKDTRKLFAKAVVEYWKTPSAKITDLNKLSFGGRLRSTLKNLGFKVRDNEVVDTRYQSATSNT